MQVEVEVLELDVDGRKLNLGHKQTQENPWDKHEETFTVGSIHEGTVKEKIDKGIIVSFAGGVDGFAPGRYLEKEDGSKLKKGEEATFKIIEFNKEFKRVVASHTLMFREQEMKNVKRASAKVAASNAEKATLGDLDALANLKEKMKGNE